MISRAYILRWSNSFLTLLAIGTALASEPQQKSEAQQKDMPGVEAIVGAIEKLEAKSDPKCHATATRLENFMYGTPLTVDARDAKVERQKALIVDLWSRATDTARKQRLQLVPDELVASIASAALPVEEKPNGDVILWPERSQPIVITERDLRQYSSVAYALRAILAVQQEALLDPSHELLPLSSGAIARIKRLIDLVTLGTLQVSDHLARERGQHEVAADTLAEAWARVFPAGPAVAKRALALDLHGVEPGQLLSQIVKQKVKSYEAYNALDKAGWLIFNNVRSYYARHDWPRQQEEIDSVRRVFTRIMKNNVADYIARAERKAKEAGQAVVRERHVHVVFQEVAPFQINQFEDITYFFHLPHHKQVIIEAYDADSFRDSGIHWMLIESVLDSEPSSIRLDFDPFAAELLAEGTAQMGVLVFRVAGLVAKEKGSPVLKPDHLLDAARVISTRMEEHLRAPRPPEKSEKLVSAPTWSGAKGEFFREASARAGINFVHRSSDWLKRFERSFIYKTAELAGHSEEKSFQLDVPPTFGGSGVAADDLDADGDDDILILGGLGNRVYINQGDGTFRDASAELDLTFRGPDGQPAEPRQPLIIDLDNDGLRDIVITYVDSDHRVYRNLGDLRFEDVTKRAGLGGKGLVGSAATALDFDRDGLLDLYISYYGNYLRGDGPTLARVNEATTPNRLFRNKGNFVFEDVTAGSGADNQGWTQAAAAVDFDQDGWQDLIVGNDFGVNAYYRNLGNGTFSDLAEKLEAKHPSNSMNVGTSDLNRDGFPDIYISNIFFMVKDEKYVLPTAETKMKRNPEKLATMRIVDANHLFTSIAENGRLARYSFNLSVDRAGPPTGWAWDADFFDFDNDGDDDLYCVNGLNEYNTFRPRRFEEPDGTVSYGRVGYELSANVKEANVLFVNDGGILRNRSEGSGADLLVNSRAAAYLDYDQDGDLDIIINNYQEPASFLENLSDRLDHNWLKVKLVGDPARGSNRDAIGATITAVTPAGHRLWRAVQGGTGYLSDHPKMQHFGLGKESRADLIIRWPNGEVSEHKGIEANRVHRIEQKTKGQSPGKVGENR